MIPNAREESLIKVLRTLPPPEAEKVLHWVRQLADLGGGTTIKWSDSWSEDDLRDATRASFEHFEPQDRDGR